MNTDPLIPSVLHVVAKETLDVSQDLQSVETKSIAQLIEEKATSEEKEKSQDSRRE